jgi:hypothetical protein
METKEIAPFFGEGGIDNGAGGANSCCKNTNSSEIDNLIEKVVELLSEEDRDFPTLVQDLKERAGVDFNTAHNAIDKAEALQIIVKGADGLYRRAKGKSTTSDPTPPAEIKSPDGATNALQTPDINNVSEGDNSDEPPADFNPPDYDPFDPFLDPEEPVYEALPPQQPEAMATEQQIGLFVLRTANQCLSDATALPVPRDLYPPLQGLIFEWEMTILSADTSIGKTALAVQIADYIAQNDIVIYADMEMSDKQFQKRCSNDYKDNYKFPDNFYRICPTRPFNIPKGKSYDDYIIESIRSVAVRPGGKVVIVDNMICLVSTDTDTSKDAIPLMDRLIALKEELGLTLILLEHTRKDRAYNYSRPLSRDDIQGSKIKLDRCDAAFGIGRSAKDPNLRYIKQFKCRSDEEIYHVDNVAVFELVKKGSLLQFCFIGFDKESNHLREVSDGEKNGGNRMPSN